VRPYRSRVVIALALFVVSAWAGWFLARSLPRLLEVELEQRLSESLHTPVWLDQLHVVPGSFVHVEALGVRAWPHPSGPGLTIQRVLGSVDALGLLAGEVRLQRVRIEGPRLRVAAVGGDSESDTLPDPDDPLNSLAGLEAAARWLLEKPMLAPLVEMRDGFIELPAVESNSSARFEVREISGRLIHRRFDRGSEIALRGRLFTEERDLGLIEVEGQRTRAGSIRIALTTESLELGGAVSNLYGQPSELKFGGKLSGEASYESEEPGIGHFEINLTGRDIHGPLHATGMKPARAMNLPRVDLNAIVDLTPESAVIRSARITNQQATLQVNATLARPIQSRSRAELVLDFDDVEVSQVRHWISLLPEVECAEAEAVLAHIESGRLVELRASGVATLSGWQDFLVSRTLTLPKAFKIDAEFADMVIRVGESDRLEEVSGQIHWSASRAEILNVSALLNGEPLPALALDIEGFPNFFAGDPEARMLRSGAEPLTGLAALWASVRSKSGSESSNIGTRIEVELDFLDHPMFLWPIRDLTLAMKTATEGIHIESVSGSWAGIPIRGEADWDFLPEHKVSVRIIAEAPVPLQAKPTPAEHWVQGRFSVGPILGERWRQEIAAGQLVASANLIQIDDLAIKLQPSGALEASGILDLSEPDAVPFEVSFDVQGGDAGSIANLVGLSPHLLLGEVDLVGDFHGTLRPDTSLIAELTGALEIAASDGIVRREAAPVVAVARANETITELDPEKTLRYKRIDTILEFDNGLMHTESFSLDGPDLGVLASGSIDLASDTKEIDGKVALFLFRKLDRVLSMIPILNLILLGTNDNLVASYFQVTGPWGEPKVKSILLPGSAGPTSMVLQGVPMFVMRGINTIRSIFTPEEPEQLPPPDSDENGS